MTLGLRRMSNVQARAWLYDILNTRVMVCKSKTRADVCHVSLPLSQKSKVILPMDVCKTHRRLWRFCDTKIMCMSGISKEYCHLQWVRLRLWESIKLCLSCFLIFSSDEPSRPSHQKAHFIGWMAFCYSTFKIGKHLPWLCRTSAESYRQSPSLEFLLLWSLCGVWTESKYQLDNWCSVWNQGKHIRKRQLSLMHRISLITLKATLKRYHLRHSLKPYTLIAQPAHHESKYEHTNITEIKGTWT